MATRKEKKRESYEQYKTAREDAFAELKQGGCIVCQDDLPAYCLDFHHTQDKDKAIGKLKIYNHAILINEICKCIVVCANCHRKIHHGGLICTNKPLDREFVTEVVCRHKATAKGEPTSTIKCGGITWEGG